MVRKIKSSRTQYRCKVCGCDYTLKSTAKECEAEPITRYSMDGVGTCWQSGNFVVYNDTSSKSKYTGMFGVIVGEERSGHIIFPVISFLGGNTGALGGDRLQILNLEDREALLRFIAGKDFEIRFEGEW